MHALTRLALAGALGLSLLGSISPVDGAEVARWPFDGDLLDAIGSQDGSFVGGANPSFTNDRSGAASRALTLDGVDDLVEIPAGRPGAGGVPVADGTAFSIAFWVRAAAGSAWVYTEGGDGPSRFAIGSDAAGRVNVWIRDAAGNDLLGPRSSAGVAFDRTWHHVVFTTTSSVARVWIDGVEDTVRFDYPLDLVSVTVARVGALAAALRPAEFLEGEVDDLRAYNHGLTRAEIEALCPPDGVCTPAELASVSPERVSTLGEALLLSGERFDDAHSVRIGGRAALDVQRESGRRLRCTTPVLPAGVHDVEVLCETGEVVAVLRDALEAVAPSPTLTRVEPDRIPEAGGIEVTVFGAGFDARTTTIRFGRAPLRSLRFSDDGTRATGIAPPWDETGGPVPLPALHSMDVFLDDPRGNALLEEGVTYEPVCDPARITSVNPGLVASNARVTFFIDGTVAPRHEVRVGSRLADNTRLITPTRLEVTVSELPVGFHDIEVYCATGVRVARLADAIEAAPPPEVLSVEPREIVFTGGAQVTVRGRHLRTTTVARIADDALLAVVVSPDGTRLVGTAAHHTVNGQPLSCVRLPCIGRTPVDVTVADSRGSDTLEDGITLIDPEPEPAAPVLLAVSPEAIDEEGGQTLTIRGEHLADSTRILVGDRPLLSLRVSGDGTSITGVAPRHHEAAPGQHPPLARELVVDLRATDPRGDAVLPDALRILPGNRPPGPEQVESSLAEGTVRLRWHNPEAYDEILVLDGDGALIARLPGDARFFETEVGDVDSSQLRLQGVTADLPSRVVAVRASRASCDASAPLAPYYNPVLVDIERKQFTVYGDHPAANVVRCAPEADVARNGEAAANAVEDRDGDGAIADVGPPIGPSLHQPLPPGNGLFVPFGFESVARTGFTLDAPAQKLEIAVFVRKLTVAFGLELRGRIRHVHPDDGFEDEFTFPSMLVSTQKTWNFVNYFRADSDVGRAIEDEDDPGPQACPDETPCGIREIPAGDYVLDFYAVGGDPNVPYFEIAADPSPAELLIPGTPCPPYPLASVRDVSGLDTLPAITDLTTITLAQQSPCFGENLRVRLEAEGLWIDACGNATPLPLWDPRVELQWKVHRKYTPTYKLWSHETWAEFCLDCGCYLVELEVRLTGCRQIRRTQWEIVVQPPVAPCANDGTRWSFSYPKPEPASVSGIIGLNTAPYNATGSCNPRRIEFDVLVSPNAAFRGCTCGNPASCPPAFAEDIEFEFAVRLVRPAPGGGVEPWYLPLGAEIEVFDEDCSNQESGAKFFRVCLEDLGSVPANVFIDVYQGANVYLVGRATGTNESWQPIGDPMRLHSPPRSLIGNPWDATWVFPSIYKFEQRTDPDVETRFVYGSSATIPIDLPGVGDLAGRSFQIDSTSGNEIRTGFTSHFKFHTGMWSALDGLGGLRGKMLSTSLTGSAIEVAPQTVFELPLEADGAVAAIPLPAYQWCENGEIFQHAIEQEIFHGLLYAGTIGPVPVTVWATVDFGFRVGVWYQTSFALRPFAESNQLEAAFHVFADMDIELPASVRAEAFWGIASVSFKLIPSVTFSTTPWLELSNGVQPHLDLSSRFRLEMAVEACVLWDTICVESPRLELFDVDIFPQSLGDCPGLIDNCGDPYVRHCDGSGFTGNGAPADFIDLGGVHELVSIPVSITSPDGLTRCEIWVRADQNDGRILAVHFGSETAEFIHPAQDPDSVPYLLDPNATFISNDVALVAITRPNEGLEPLPEDIFDPEYLDIANRNVARADIWVHALTEETTAGFGDSGQPLSESSANIADWRGDGMATMAGMVDLGEAFLAWVRYRTEFFEDRGTKTIAVPCKPGDPCLPSHPNFATQVTRDIQPRLDQTGIFVRRLGYDATTGSVTTLGAPIDIAPPGINIEPSIAALPAGDLAACAWVHDGVHDNLIASNRDRELLVSTFDPVGGWSAPQSVLPPDAPGQFRYPGVLGPKILLRRLPGGELRGLLAFTACPPNALEDDTGLAGIRYLYIVRISEAPDGSLVFAEPELIRGACDERIYIWEYDIGINVPTLVDPLDEIKSHLIDWVIVYNERGPGPAATGLLHAMTVGSDPGERSHPVFIGGEGERITNLSASVGAGGIVDAFYLSEGASSGVGAIAGGRRHSFERASVPLEPDLRIASCRLSDPMPGPGARITARVRVENAGLAGSYFTGDDESLSSVELVYEESGVQRVVARSALGVLPAGASEELEFEIEMPHDPVILIARLVAPEDAEPSNDAAECFFGAPAPFDLSASSACLGDRRVVSLSWRNPVAYDSVSVFRDDLLLVELAASEESFTDLDVETGEHRYSVRGRVETSTSTRTATALLVENICEEEPTPSERFRRGDFNDSRVVDLSDAVAVLNYLFLGGRASVCLDSGDINDSGAIDISDPVSLLNFLFLGGPPPRLPGPTECGPDPTADTLGNCAEVCD